MKLLLIGPSNRISVLKKKFFVKKKEEGYLLDVKKLIHYAIILYGEEMKSIECGHLLYDPPNE